MGIADHYDGIKATVINRNDGPVDSLTLRFADVLGRKDNTNSLARKFTLRMDK